MDRQDVRYLLVSVPLTDPTASYHSIPYLVGATAAAGFSGWRCVDANIDALNYLAAEERVEDLLNHAARVRGNLEQQTRLSRGDQLRYRYALRAVGLRPDSVQRAIDVLRDAEAFYDYGRYRQATLVLKRWLDVLSIRGFAGQFGDFTLRINNVGSLSRLEDLTNAAFLERITAPLAPYFEAAFDDVLDEHPWDLVGISINYTSQLPFGISLARQIRRRLPDTVLCVGGTEISDDLKCLRDSADIWKLFPGCDAIVGGEGESALIRMLQAIAEERPLPTDQPGLLVRHGVPLLTDLPVSFENMAQLPAPRYDVVDLDRYWSPEPVLLYSPTRGCYWNKCTFCDYGLNTDLPTSPSRNRPVELVVEELRFISQYARTFYFSVDAIAPAYLRRLAQAIAANGLKLRWSAELRLEKTLLRGMAQELRDAGCVAISFGYESGTQRILDLINKGVVLGQVPDLLSELARVGIAAQMMGFTGFPSETADEARNTFAFLLEHRDLWTLAGIGQFVLTPGAIVAKRPADFQVQRIGPFEGEDIVRSLYWVDANQQAHFDGGGLDATIQPMADSVVNFVDDRPFVGGIDSAHSILYFAHYGRALVPADLRDALAADPIVKTEHYSTPLSNVDRFVTDTDLAHYHRQRRAVGQSASLAEIMAWLEETPEKQPPTGDREVLEIYPSGDFMRYAPDLDAFERQASPAYHRAKQLLLRESGVV
jgi:anaerobic magnesium-protoporphyrin IX monomethyl ester cyclase